MSLCSCILFLFLGSDPGVFLALSATLMRSIRPSELYGRIALLSTHWDELLDTAVVIDRRRVCLVAAGSALY